MNMDTKARKRISWDMIRADLAPVLQEYPPAYASYANWVGKIQKQAPECPNRSQRLYFSYDN